MVQGYSCPGFCVSISADQLIRMLVDAKDAIFITGMDGRVLMVNREFSRISGFEPAKFVGMPPSIFAPGVVHTFQHDDSIWISAARNGGWRGEATMQKADGKLQHVWMSIGAVSDSEAGVFGHFGIVSDVGGRIGTYDQIARMAHYDPLTNLPNRNLLQERLNSLMKVSRRNGSEFSVLFIDLDRFKAVNDTFGHQAGDKLLSLVAQRLLGCVRDSDIVSRVGGDEFVVVLPDTGRDGAMIVAEKLRYSLCQPFIALDLVLNIGGSIGVGVFPEDGVSLDELIKVADQCMYRHKREGRGELSVVAQ